MSTATTAVADADLLIIDDGANGTNNKITRGNLLGSSLAAFDNGLTSTTISASSTLQAVGNAILGGTLSVSGNADLDGTLNVEDAATFQAAITGTSFSGSGDLQAAGNAFIEGTLNVTGNATFEGSIGGATTISGSSTISGHALDIETTANIAGQTTLASVQVSDLTQTRVVVAGASGELSDSANLSFVSNNLVVVGNISGSGQLQMEGGVNTSGNVLATGSLGSGQLTDTRIPFANSSKRLQDSSQLTFSSSTLKTVHVSGSGGAQFVGASVFGNTLNVTGAATFANKITVLGNSSEFGADGSGVDVTFFGAQADEELKYSASGHTLTFTDSSDATHITIGGNSNSEFAIDVVEGSNNKNKIRAAAFVTYSDESLKTDVTSMADTALDTIMSLNGVEFTWKNNGERDFGFIAQEVSNVVPKAVHTAQDGVQGVDYSRLTSILVEAVKAQQVQIDELKKQLKK